jgi:hypothetical protein
MKKILIAGVLYQPFASFPVMRQSDDGKNWDDAVRPFDVGDSPTAMATDGINVAISNGRGYLAVTTDMQTFSTVPVMDGFGITDLSWYSGAWMACGQVLYLDSYGPYPANSEVAQIHSSTSAGGPWSMIWSHPYADSRFYQMKHFNLAPINGTTTSSVWVACGSVGNQGDAWYSIDGGITWNETSIPSGVGRITSVELVTIGSTKYWYWGGNGTIFRSTSLQETEWNQLYIDPTSTVTDMISHNGSLLISGTDGIYSSQDGFYLRRWNYPGYVFDRIAYIENDDSVMWLAFARSTLTQYTQWSSTDLINWEASNNNVHVSGHTLGM